MKIKTTLLLVTVAVISSVAAGFVIHQQTHSNPASQEKIFQVRGKIIELPTDGTTVRVQHEAIPGYMPAMIMPLPVKNPGLLQGFKTGDSILFRLCVTENDSSITHIEKLMNQFAPDQAPHVAQSNKETDVERLELGEPVPEVTLVNQDARPFRLSDFHGKAVLVTFIYTRCPLPNFCPLMSKNFAELQQRLQKDVPGRFQLVSITMDPDFDRPEILKGYSLRYTENTEGWTFATGTPEQIDAVTGMFGVIRKSEGGLISHNLATALISPDGRLVHVWKSNVWTPYEIQRALKESLEIQVSKK